MTNITPIRPAMSDTVREALEALKKVASTLCARQKNYGDPLDCFSNIACMWNLLGLRRNGDMVDKSDVSLAMIALKLCRQSASPATDNWVDIAGYASLAAALEKSNGAEELPDPEASA